MRTQPCETRPGRIPGWFVPWMPDEAAAGPIGEHRRAGADPDRDRSVDRHAVAGQHLTRVEVTARCRPVVLSDADTRREHLPPATVESRAKPAAGDEEPRADRPVPPQRLPRDPAGRAVRQDGEADLNPDLTVAELPLVQGLDEVREVLRRRRLQRAERARATRRPAANRGPARDEGPLVALRLVVAENGRLRPDPLLRRMPWRRRRRRGAGLGDADGHRSRLGRSRRARPPPLP